MQKNLFGIVALVSIATLCAQEENVAPQETPVSEAMPEMVAPAEIEAEKISTPSQEVLAEQAAPVQQEAPAVQAPVTEVPEEQEPVHQPPVGQPATEEELEIVGFDNVNLAEPKGNWLYKRIWWEKAERLYEKIKELADKIQEFRIVFFARRHELNHTILDPFYINLGIERGELGETIAYFIEFSEQTKQEEAAPDEKRAELLQTVAQEKKTLEQLQQEAQTVNKIDHALDDALMRLDDQLNQAHRYEQLAWQNFKAINRELSDKKARELYYGMDTYWKNLNTINTYLSDPFTKYFEQLVAKIEQETGKIKTVTQGLKEKGIDLQAQALKLRGGVCKAPQKEAEEKPEEEETGILGTLWSWIKAPFVAVGNAVSGLFGWVSGWFGGSSEQEVSLAKPSKAAAIEKFEEENEE